MHPLTTLVMGLVFLCLAVFACESPLVRGVFGEIRRMWKAAGVPGRIIAVLLVVMCTQSAGSKGISPVSKLFQMLLWAPAQPWTLLAPASAIEAAEAANVSTTNDAVAIIELVSDVTTISFDWHAPDRLPYHDRQNVMGWVPWVFRTNINGVLCDDHYVAFNAAASTNPAVILIEYARTRDDGTVERYSQPVVTNSYPATRTVTLQSGTHTCYWFRCEVPIAFTNRVRDWNGEALFGSPEGSGKGFDVLGTLIVDDGNQIWVGATTNVVIGGITNEILNGINITKGTL